MKFRFLYFVFYVTITSAANPLELLIAENQAKIERLQTEVATLNLFFNSHITLLEAHQRRLTLLEECAAETHELVKMLYASNNTHFTALETHKALSATHEIFINQCQITALNLINRVEGMELRLRSLEAQQRSEQQLSPVSDHRVGR